MNIFFTSDCFFGRNLTAIERGFSSSEELLDVYVENWNSRVKKDDVVYHLGNFAWDPISSESALIHLNGKIYFVLGSYDSHMHENSLVKLGRHTILANQVAVLPQQNIILSHWPLLDWPGKSEGAIHVHGGEEKTSVEKGNRFNVNIKNWNSAPIELEFLQEAVQSRTAQNQ